MAKLPMPDLYALIPFEQWEFQDVTFPTADTPVRVTHSLKTNTPEDIVYFIARQGSSAVVCDAVSQTAYVTEWRNGSIVLQSTVAGTMTLLLAVPKRRLTV